MRGPTRPLLTAEIIDAIKARPMTPGRAFKILKHTRDENHLLDVIRDTPEPWQAALIAELQSESGKQLVARHYAQRRG